MKIIQKRADELKRGDLLVDGRIIVIEPRTSVNEVSFLAHNEQETRIFEHFMEPDRAVQIVAPDLTPAQQHADRLIEHLNELASYVQRRAHDDVLQASAIRAMEFLDAIKPPEPPTLAEALDLLGRIPSDFTTIKPPEAQAVRDLLDRARRAGLI